ncbi:MAG: sulfotransferase [Solirubrobacterales bacterium]
MHRSPLVILGTGGSGTRVFTRLAEAAGRCMGAHQSEGAHDALALYWLAERWCGEIYTAWRRSEEMDLAGFDAELKPCVEVHLIEAEPEAPWGWKQPRSLYLLPALLHSYPDLLVVHVIRDGRDIAFGSEHRLKMAGSYAVPEWARDLPTEVKLALLWDEPNRLAADFCEKNLGERYLRLRLEDVCANPEATAARLANFAEGAEIAPARVHSIVETPASLGRWRGRDPALVDEVEHAAGEGLARFGYAGA